MREEELVIDSAFTLDEALAGLTVPDDIREALTLVTVHYYGFDGRLHQGQLVLHDDLAEDIIEIFEELKNQRFTIERVAPIVIHDWDDNVSMRENTTSAFNYRVIAGTDQISNHAYGRAIDINPAVNPYTLPDGTLLPEGAQYKPGNKGVIHAEDEIVALFLSRGWRWLGHRTEQPDWQHFEKPA